MKRIFLIILIWFLISSKCFRCFEFFEFERNPDLQFLAGDTLHHSIHLTNPVVSPDGKIVYYLCAPGDSAWGNEAIELACGAIYAIDIENKHKKLILNGKYKSLTISPDGKKIAVHLLKGPYPVPFPESLILVINLKNLEIDTYSAVSKRINDLEFSPVDTNYLYYSCGYFYKRIYRLNLSNGATELIMSNLKGGFDIFKNGEIYTNDPLFDWLQINPLNENYIIGHNGGSNVFDTIIMMRRISDGKIIYFEHSAFHPYLTLIGRGWLGQPYWFPDGNTVVFSYSLPMDPGGEPAELWILRNVFKHIKGEK